MMTGLSPRRSMARTKTEGQPDDVTRHTVQAVRPVFNCGAIRS